MEPVKGALINGTPFFPLAGISTTAATPSTSQFENLKENIKLDIPRLNKLPEFQKVKGFDVPIAVVGGGPDLKNQLDELRQFRTIIAAGSVHDFLIKNNIIPTYAVICDPDPVGLNYFTMPHTEVKYLISSGCDPLMFKHFENYQRVLWHCHSDDWNDGRVLEFDPAYDGIGGGCTVGLRCCSIAVLLGYGNVHLFGFDSCLANEPNGYAYPLSTEQEKEQGKIYKVAMGAYGDDAPRDMVYECLGYHLAQAEHFKQFWGAYYAFFTPTFHGRGLLPDYINMIQDKIRKGEIPQIEAERKVA